MNICAHMGTGYSQAVCNVNTVLMVQTPSLASLPSLSLHPTFCASEGRASLPAEGKLGLRSKSRCRSKTPVVIHVAFPHLRVRLPIRNSLACDLLSSGTPGEEELTGKRKQNQTNYKSKGPGMLRMLTDARQPGTASGWR